ncbi:MAG: hypothetical protein WKF37_10335 [Bryobacteraceae bacterium]
MVGQSFVKFLQNHPWFDPPARCWRRSAGRKCRDATSWRLDGGMPQNVTNQDVHESKPGHAPKLLFSAMDASVATAIEQSFASAGHTVVSNCAITAWTPMYLCLFPK